MKRCRLQVLLISAACWLSAAVVPAMAAEWVYTVRPGDEIWNIASRYCGSATFAKRIIEFNQLADERRIRPGTRIRIPVKWLIRQPVHAEVLSVRGTAELLTPEPEPARVGRRIEMGHRLRTADGSVLVGFADGSSLQVAADSDVLFNVLTAYGDTGMVDTNLRFYRGRGTSRVIRRNDASSFRISSPAGTAAVRGTEFRVAVDGDHALTETLEGRVGFVRDTETAVPAGYGLAASPGGDVREALLPAPVWISAPGRHASGTELRWQPLADAQRYRTSIYLAGDDGTPVSVDTRDTTTLTLQALPPADYRIVVRGISSSALEGYESALNVVLTRPAPEPEPAALFDRGETILRWHTDEPGPYTVEVAEDAAFERILWRQDVPDEEAAPELAPGQYLWRVQSPDSDFSPARPLTIRPRPPADIAFSSQSLKLKVDWKHPAADEYRIRISRDPDLATTVVDTLVTSPAYTVQLDRAGTYHVEVTARVNAVDSRPVVAQSGVHRRPWWLLGVLVIPFLL